MSRSPAPVVNIQKRKAQATLAAEQMNAGVVLTSGITEKHKTYKGMVAIWNKTRHFLDGDQTTMQQYIRKLPGHGKDEADLYKQQAYLLPAVARTQEAFTGLIMNPEPVISVPEELSEYKKDITNDGEPVVRMIARTVNEVIGVSRCAVLVDFPRIEGEAKELTVAEAEALGLRAYARFYKAEDILDWRTSVFGGQRYLSFIKLREKYIERLDEWTSREVEQMRVLDFAPLSPTAGANAEEFYRVRIYRQGVGGWQIVGEPFFPQADGEYLDEIPIVVFGPKSLDPSEVEKPLLYDMVKISESHFNNSALLEWALMWVGNPTAVFRGLLQVKNGDGTTEPVRLGSSQGIVTTEEGGADILYLPAEGVGAIRQTMEDKRRDMAAVGARVLADETKAQIARDTAIIQRAGEHSVLASVAMTVGDGWTRVLRLIAVWAGVQVEEDKDAEVTIDVKLNTDYVPLGLQPGELKDLMSGVQSGTISSQDLFTLLQKRGVIRPDKTFEEHEDEVEADDARIASSPRLGGVAAFDAAQENENASETGDQGNTGAPKKPAAKKAPAKVQKKKPKAKAA